MIANGNVTFEGRLIAEGVLVQIRPDADSPGWHGTLKSFPPAQRPE